VIRSAAPGPMPTTASRPVLIGSAAFINGCGVSVNDALRHVRRAV